MLAEIIQIAASDLERTTVSDRMLQRRLNELVRGGHEQSIRQAAWYPTTPEAGTYIRGQVDEMIGSRPTDETFALELFVLPVILILGATKDTALPSVLSEPVKLNQLLEEKGVLGHCKNFGLSNALTDYDALYQYPLNDWMGAGARRTNEDNQIIDLPPVPLEIKKNVESAHLRFLFGAVLNPKQAPSIFATSGDIGRWGTEFAKEVSQQLTTSDCSVLAIPRPLKTPFMAMEQGYWSVREIGFQLFISNALKYARPRVGEPDISIDITAADVMAVRISSVFDDTFDRTYSYPIAPYEFGKTVLDAVNQFLTDARVARYELVSNEGSNMVQLES